MRVRHPRAADDTTPPSTVDVEGEHVSVSDDGTFEVPDTADRWLDRFAEAYGVATDDLLVETCTVEKSDGEVCGRHRPCPYHDDNDAQQEG